MPVTTKVLCPVGNFLLGPVVTNTTVTFDDIDIIDGDLLLGQGEVRRKRRGGRIRPPARAVVGGRFGMRNVVYGRYHVRMRGTLGDVRNVRTAMALGPPMTAMRFSSNRGALRRLRGMIAGRTNSCALGTWI